MKLRKIEALGFKSFADRQVIVVDDHVTGVIGPNGCGKSNIVDAVRWCMGEQSAKHLRGAGMADVIFAGCQSRGPAGMAEVTLTFDNDGRVPAAHLDMPQIGITRRLFSDGTSEYLINKVPARLRDITELLMGTGAGTKGYAIIEQGQVGKIVSSKPEERRHIIDEAAGITRFKAQKAAAQRKIEATRLNLVRVGDVVAELEGRISTLRRQAQKAERYRRYRDEMRDLELWIATHKVLELLVTGNVLSQRRAELATRVDDLRASIATRDAQIETGRLELHAVERELSERQAAVYDADNRVRLLEAEEDYRRREREGLVESATASRGEADGAERGLASVEVELVAVEGELDALGDGRGDDGPVAAVERLQADHDAATAALRTASSDRDDAQRGHASMLELLAELRARRQARDESDREADDRIAQLQATIVGLEQQVAGAHARLAEGQGERTRQAARLQTLYAERGALDRERAELRELVAAAEVEIDTTRAEVHRARSRLSSLQEIQQRYRGCTSSVQVVMEHRAELSGVDAEGRAFVGPAEPAVHGILADFVEAPPHLEAAVAAVLGDRLQGVVVDDPAIAARGVQMLKRLQEGRTTFLPRVLPHSASGSATARGETSGSEAPVGWSMAKGLGGTAIEVLDLTAGGEPGLITPLDPHVDAVAPDDVTAPLELLGPSERGDGFDSPPSRASVAIDGDLGDASVGDRGPSVEGDTDASRRLSQLLSQSGVVGRLSDLVRIGRRLAALGDVLLGDTIVVDDLAVALQLWRAHVGQFAFVTLDGDRVEPSGVVVGGSPTSLDSALLAQKREIEDLQKILVELGGTFETVRGRHLALAGRLAEVERAREILDGTTLEAEKAHVRAEESVTAGQQQCDAADAQLTEMQAELVGLQARAEQRRLEHIDLSERVAATEASAEDAKARGEAATAAVQAHAEALERIGEALTEAKITLARFQQQAEALRATRERLRRQVGSERERIAKLREAAERADLRVVQLREKSEEAAVERTQLVEHSRAMTQKVHDSRERHDAQRLALDELEASVRTLRGDLDEQRERLQEVDLGLQEIALERGHLEQDARDRFDVEIASVLVDFHDRPVAGANERERHKELRKILARMGEVNLTAIEEYEDVSTRYEYLSGQKRDLEQAIDQLQEAIDKINKTTRQLFRDAFTAIDERFQQLFPRLFNGGRARLKMTDPSDLLGTGVEIEAQPPGKQLRSLELLSGGEKALTAVSLIFAVFLYKPSPFCILDEVDAPLDDANVARCCKLIRELAADTQFIVITHNKITMESSDRLYGVTMEQRGISKLVSVNMRRAVELAYN